VSSTRTPVRIECTECGSHRKEELHPSDTTSSIRIVCRECRSVTEHDTGSPEWYA